MLDELELMETQIGQLEQNAAELMHPYADAVERLAEMPGMGVVSALQVIAEIGPTAEAFPTPGNLCSWVGVIPGQNITAEPAAASSGQCRHQNQRQHLSTEV
jgi:transposase